MNARARLHRSPEYRAPLSAMTKRHPTLSLLSMTSTCYEVDETLQEADDQRRREQRCTQIGQIEKLPFLLGVELRDGLAHVAAPSPTPKAGTVYAVEQTPFAPVGSLPVNPTSLQSVNARLVVLRRRVP